MKLYDYISILLVLPNFLLSISSLIFKVNTQRIKSSSVIWKEMQLHNIIFNSRSITLFGIMIYYPTISVFIRYCWTMIFHLMADYVTYKFPANKYSTTKLTTVRGSPEHNVSFGFSPLFDSIVKIGNYIASFSQLLAIISLIFSPNINDTEQLHTICFAFFMCLSIQISAFLFTLVKKSIISSEMSMTIYIATLLFMWKIKIWSYFQFGAIIYASIGRFVLNINKYILWSSLVIFYYILSHYDLDNFNWINTGFFI